MWATGVSQRNGDGRRRKEGEGSNRGEGWGSSASRGPLPYHLLRSPPDTPQSVQYVSNHDAVSLNFRACTVTVDRGEPSVNPSFCLSTFISVHQTLIFVHQPFVHIFSVLMEGAATRAVATLHGSSPGNESPATQPKRDNPPDLIVEGVDLPDSVVDALDGS